MDQGPRLATYVLQDEVVTYIQKHTHAILFCVWLEKVGVKITAGVVKYDLIELLVTFYTIFTNPFTISAQLH